MATMVGDVQYIQNGTVSNPCGWPSLIQESSQHMAVCQNPIPLVDIKIAGKWMFIPLKMVLIGIDPLPYHNWDGKCSIQKKHLETINQKHCQMRGLVSEQNGGFFPRMRSPSGNQVRKSKSLFWGGKWSATGLSSIARLGTFCRKKKRERKTSSLQA